MCWAQRSSTYWSNTHAEAGSTSTQWTDPKPRALQLWAAALQAASMCRILAFVAHQGTVGRVDLGRLLELMQVLLGRCLCIAFVIVCAEKVGVCWSGGTARTTCSGYCGRNASVLNGWKHLTVDLMTLPRALVCHIVVHCRAMTIHDMTLLKLLRPTCRLSTLKCLLFFSDP